MRAWWIVVAGSGCVVGGGEVSYRFDDAAALSVSLANGSVTVDPSEDGSTVLEWDGGGLGRAASPEVSLGPDRTVRFDARGQLGGGDLVAHVAPGLPVTVLLDRGDVDVALDAPADLDLCVAAGSVTVEVPPGPWDLDVSLGAGEVSLGVDDTDGAPFTLAICAGAGDVSIEPRAPGGDGS